MSSYLLFPAVAEEAKTPEKGIHSRTLHNDERTKVIIFGFAAGEELSAHTAPVPAILHFLAGEAEVRLGDDTHQVHAGALAYMPPQLTHAIRAKTPLLMLLIMVKNAPAGGD